MRKSREQLKRDEEHLKILKEQEENTRKLLELEKRKAAMRTKMNTKEMKILDREMEFCQMKTASLTQISMAMAEKDEHDKFRSSCLKMVRQFKKFQELFLEDLKSMKPVFNGQREWDMRKPENLNDALASLEKFRDLVQTLTIIGEETMTTFSLTKNQEVMVGSSGDLYSKLLEIITELESGMEHGRIEDMKLLRKLYDDAENEMKQLNDLVVGFEIPPSQRLEQVITEQMKKMSSHIETSKVLMEREELEGFERFIYDTITSLTNFWKELSRWVSNIAGFFSDLSRAIAAEMRERETD